MPLGCLRLGGGGGGKVLKLLIDRGITLEQSGFKLVWISFFLFFFCQRVYCKSVPETIFFRLVQYFAIVLFE